MFFISIKRAENTLGSKEICALCDEKVKVLFHPMKEWGIDGVLLW